MMHCPNPECSGLKRSGAVQEFQDTAIACSDCGTALVPGPAPDPADLTPTRDRPAPDPDLVMVEVGSLQSEPDIALAHSMLDDAGIPHFTQGEPLQDLFGVGRVVNFNPLIRPVRFFAPEDQARDARIILEELKLARDADPGSDEGSDE